MSNCVSFANSLGLQPEADGLFIGRILGFPVGLKFIDPTGMPLLLFEVRHWLKADSSQLKSLSYDEEITKLLAEKKIEIEFEDRKAWVTINDGTEAMERGFGSRIINSMLQAFAKAGLIGDPILCHYCQKTKVESVRYIEGKVVQICAPCLDERMNKVTRAATTAEAVPIFLMTPAAALVGAVLWAVFWVNYTLFFERLDVKRIWVPGGIMVVVFVGLIVGGPVGWIIKQNRKRGRAVAVAAAILFASAAVIVGEILYLVWLIYHKFQVVSFSAALKILPDFYRDNDLMFVMFKIINAFAAVATAEIIAKPKEATLQL